MELLICHFRESLHRCKTGAALGTKFGVRRSDGVASGALHGALAIAVADDQAADVGNPGESVGENKNGIAPVNAVNEQKEGTDQTQPPKRVGYDDLAFLFGDPPLDEEPGEEDDVADPANHLPKMPLDAEKFVVDHERLQTICHRGRV